MATQKDFSHRKCCISRKKSCSQETLFWRKVRGRGSSQCFRLMFLNATRVFFALWSHPKGILRPKSAFSSFWKCNRLCGRRIFEVCVARSRRGSGAFVRRRSVLIWKHKHLTQSDFMSSPSWLFRCLILLISSLLADPCYFGRRANFCIERFAKECTFTTWHEVRAGRINHCEIPIDLLNLSFRVCRWFSCVFYEFCRSYYSGMYR